jgi:hypothetical protein
MPIVIYYKYELYILSYLMQKRYKYHNYEVYQIINSYKYYLILLFNYKRTLLSFNYKN